MINGANEIHFGSDIRLLLVFYNHKALFDIHMSRGFSQYYICAVALVMCSIVPQVNCFSVGNEEVEARALYPTAYLFQHDCTPNTTHVDSEGFTMTVRASVDIQKGMPITLTYTNSLNVTILILYLFRGIGLRIQSKFRIIIWTVWI